MTMSTTESKLEIKQSAIGTVNWILQRFSAIFLIIFLGFHLTLMHFLPLNATFDAVTTRLRAGLYIFVDLTLLLLVTYHGLNGVRMILYDIIVKDKYRKVIAILLIITGIVTFAFGAWILVAAISAA